MNRNEMNRVGSYNEGNRCVMPEELSKDKDKTPNL